jgi:dTDP-4-amino-4,6-dideoxygalactose transaminase
VTHAKPNSSLASDGPAVSPRALQIVRPVFPDAGRFLDAFQEALASGQVTNNGRWVREFERKLTDYLEVPTLAFCNGQLALMTMLRAAGIDSGEVIVPSFTFSATPHAIRWCGAEPVFADVDPRSLCLDPRDVERKVTPRTVAILGVDAYGICCDYRALAEVGRRHGVRVLYDSAPSFGARVDGRPTGDFGDAQIFSFHATKAFPIMEGGCLCSRDQGIFERARAIRNFGQRPDGDCAEPGLNGKLTEICALIGIEQFRTFEQAAERRRHAVLRMRSGLAGIPGVTVVEAPPNQEPIWLYLPVIIDAGAFGVDRDRVATLLEAQGLYVRKYYSPPCHHMSAYSAAREQRLPVTERTAYNVLALPVYNDMTDEECDAIVFALHETHRTAQGARIAAR